MSTIEFLTNRAAQPHEVNGTVEAKSKGRADLLVAIDLETGGFNPGWHALLSVAVYAGEMENGFTGQRLQWDQCVWPENAYSVETGAKEMNGYSPEAWEERGAVNEGVALVRLIEVLTNWLSTEGAGKCVMVAHGAPFDQGFLYAALRRHDLEGEWEKIVHRRWRCSCATLGAMMDAGLLPEGNAGLDDLNTLRLLPRRTGVHEAREDARLCFDGYVWLISEMKRFGLGGRDGLSGLAMLRAGEVPALTDEPLPWCEECQSWHPVPRDEAHWWKLMCRKPFSEWDFARYGEAVRALTGKEAAV